MNPMIRPTPGPSPADAVRSVQDLQHISLVAVQEAWRAISTPQFVYMHAWNDFMKAAKAFTDANTAYQNAATAHGKATCTYQLAIAQATSTFAHAVMKAMVPGNYSAIAQADADYQNALKAAEAAFAIAVAEFEEAKKAYAAAVEAYQRACMVWQAAQEAYSKSQAGTSASTSSGEATYTPVIPQR